MFGQKFQTLGKLSLVLAMGISLSTLPLRVWWPRGGKEEDSPRVRGDARKADRYREQRTGGFLGILPLMKARDVLL